MSEPDRPYTLIAELTHRCGLRCGYCSNPLELERRDAELATEGWTSVLEQAAALGVMQVNFSGGEPLLRDDLAALVQAARNLDLYTSLITSGVPLLRERLTQLHAAGLESVQLSVQDVTEAGQLYVAGRVALEQKLLVADWVKELGLPLTLNVVLHRGNIARTPDFIELAARLGAQRLELANTQYLSWALHNRHALLPTRQEIEQARAVALRARERFAGRMDILFVLPDYYSDRPKACMGGWGKRFIVVNPSGTVLPCHLAHTLPGFRFDNVRDRALSEIWHESPGFNAFRGQHWMPEPCRGCARREIDFGGCRCQAFHLTGDASLTDPACSLSPHHQLVVDARPTGPEPQLIPLTLRGGAPHARAAGTARR